MKQREVAVAIGYEPARQDAPTVLAAGFGEVAKAIMHSAVAHGIPIHGDTTLAELLAHVPVGSAIPEQAYQLVAELLAFLCRTDAAMAEKMSGDER